MNYIRRFKIGTTNSDLWYWVFVYNDIEKLRLDAKNYKQEDDFIDMILKKTAGKKPCQHHKLSFSKVCPESRNVKGLSVCEVCGYLCK